MGVTLEVDLAELLQLGEDLAQLHRRAEDMSPFFEAAGALLEGSTVERFHTNVAPDGHPWRPSIRATRDSGKTLVDRGNLVRSIKYEAGPNSVEVGSDGHGDSAKYAAIHQTGGTITAKAGPYLRFRIGEAWVAVASVTIPARPFLGISAQDEGDLGALWRDFMEGLNGY